MKEFLLLRFLILSVFAITASTAWAQSSGVAFGGFGYNPDAAVEITADSLDIDQSSGSATFDGNVVIGQGEMRLSANQVVVEYGENATGNSEIKRLVATGQVTLVSASEAAEADRAVYDVEDGKIVMSGSVLVTQGIAAISGDQLSVDLATGDGSIEGNVRTLLNSGSDQ